MSEKILVLNFGSTSSKVAIYDGSDQVFAKTVRHDPEFLAAAKKQSDQIGFRREGVLEAVDEAGYSLEDFDAVCSRAGSLKPVASGTYVIDDSVLKDAADPSMGGRMVHGVSLFIAKEISDKYGIPAYLCDPVTTDELIDIARPSGMKGMDRISGFHALNQKRVAKLTAEKIGRPYEELNLIGVHMGGGVSVAAHCRGRCIDEFACIDEGCFSMDRAGSVPNRALIDYCFSGRTKDEVLYTMTREAGVYSYLGTSDFREVEERMENGDEEAGLIFRTMAYQHAKCIGEMAAAMSFKVDAVFLTGGIIYSRRMVSELKKYIGDLAPVYEFPGEDEMQALADNALAALRGEIEAKKY